jgi:capsular exopolysaccharide synthesis family protein
VELIDYFRVLRRRWVLIAVTTLACVGGAAVATISATPLYQSSARWLLVAGDGEVGANAALTFLAQRESIVALADTGPVVDRTRQLASIPDDVSLSILTAAEDVNTPIIATTATSSSPQAAQQALEVLPQAVAESLADLQQIPSPSYISFEALSAPGLPGSPASPSPFRNLLVGLALGVVLGVAAAFVRDALDTRLRDVDSIEGDHSLDVLAVVPSELRREMLPALRQPQSARAEAYRKIRTHLLFAGPAGLPRSILLTSPNPGEGKTSLATNLAVVCHQSGQSVVVVDADLRRPMAATYLIDQRPERGLVDVLLGQADLEECLVAVRPGLLVLPSGSVPTNPSELVGSQGMADVLRQLEANADLVLVDAPPVLPVADAIHLSALCEGTVLCARAGETTETELRRSREALDRVGAHLLGVALMADPTGSGEPYGYGYRPHGYRYDSRAPARDVSDADAARLVPAAERRARPSGGSKEA